MLLSQVKQPSITHQQQHQDAPHQMMNVVAAHHHPLERPVLMHNAADEQPYAGKCEEK